MLEFYREYLVAREEHTRLLTILADAQRAVSEPEQQVALATEIARRAQEHKSTVERAIDAWKGVLRLEPGHREALGSLETLYRDSQKWNSLAELLKSEVGELDEASVERKLELLRQLVTIYRDQLQLDVMVIQTYKAILELVPDDPEALSALESTYESTGRWAELITVLNQNAGGLSDPVQRVETYLRVARLWIERFSNYNKATQPLERVLEIEPSNEDALGMLTDIYRKRRSWAALFDLLEKRLESVDDDSERLDLQAEMARLAGDRLRDKTKALSLWRAVAENGPEPGAAIAEWVRLAEKERNWSALVDALGRMAEVHPDKRLTCLQKMGALYADKLGDHEAAISVWRQVVDADPSNARVMRTLREAYIAAQRWDELESLCGQLGDWEGLVTALGNAAERADQPQTTVELSFRAARIYEDEIGEPHRAFRSYERVLAVDADNVRAARALIPIYEQDEKWGRLPPLFDVVLRADRDHIDDDERHAIMLKLAGLHRDHLGQPAAAFDWAVRAYRVGGRLDVDFVQDVADAAERWSDLANVYEEYLGDGSLEPETARNLTRRLADLRAGRLGQPEQAARHFWTLLNADRSDEEAARRLQELLRASGKRD